MWEGTLQPKHSGSSYYPDSNRVYTGTLLPHLLLDYPKEVPELCYCLIVRIKRTYADCSDFD